ncbi:hypothetical protein HMPREF9095_0275 [Haemophilus aegyptius ATCC 11116]|nr:hypothetical protein HMPREF9095_0275 [Haemophilus aegyptius ATCC 11116]
MTALFLSAVCFYSLLKEEKNEINMDNKMKYCPCISFINYFL